jgi:riboflavin kinase
LKGTVFSGKSEGAKFVNLSWVRKQVEERLGFAPYPGTLNVKLTGESIEMKKPLIRTAGVEISPTLGYYSGRLFKATLKNVECAVVIPQVSGYPEDVIELISSANLRERLHLVDGSLVEVEVTV